MGYNPVGRVIENAIYKYNTSNSDRFIRYLRNKGISIGEDCIFYAPRTITIDITRPSLITVGNNVRITQGVTVLTHGAEWHVLREMYRKPLGSAGKVAIKDNVFIGMRSIILKGVTINENSIVGAGSVVTRDVPTDTVVAGNPARPIMSIRDYYFKREEAQLGEAREYARSIKERYNRLPVKEDFWEFFQLFMERDLGKFGGVPVRSQVGRYMEDFMKTRPEFKSFEDFLKYCGLV